MSFSEDMIFDSRRIVSDFCHVVVKGWTSLPVCCCDSYERMPTLQVRRWRACRHTLYPQKRECSSPGTPGLKCHNGVDVMPAKRRLNALQTASKEACKHHWIIEFAQEETSKGVCRLCGQKREFSNQLQPVTDSKAKQPRAPRPHQTEWETEESRSLVG